MMGKAQGAWGSLVWLRGNGAPALIYLDTTNLMHTAAAHSHVTDSNSKTHLPSSPIS
jgi:hypothetical protein